MYQALVAFTKPFTLKSTDLHIGFRVQGVGFRVQGSGFGVQRSGFRIFGDIEASVARMGFRV